LIHFYKRTHHDHKSMNSYQYLDELVREYLTFRGFTATLKSFDADLKNEKEKGFRVDKIVDQFSQYITNHDLTGLIQLWKDLETKIFLRLENQRLVTVRKLENSLLKLYLVTCAQNKQLEKLREFYERLTVELQGQTEWKDWFALPYVKDPQDNPSFSLYFSRQWQDTLFLSLNNFLSVVFQCLPPPRLADFNKREARFGAMREELRRLKLRIASTGLDIDPNIAKGNFKHLEPPPTKENMDDFFLISQETAVVDSQVKSLRSFLRTITGGASSTDRKKSPVIGSKSRSSSKSRQVLLPSSSSSLSSQPRQQTERQKKVNTASSSSDQGIVDITCTNMSSNKHPTSPEISSYLMLGQDSYREHRASLSLLAVSSVGGRVVSVDSSGVIKVWTTSPSPLTLATFISGSPVSSVCWVGGSDKYLLYGTRGGQARLCNVTDMSVVEVSQELLGGQPVTVLESGPTYNTFLLCSGIKILLMETANCQLDRDLSHPSLKPIVCAQFNHNGSVLIHAGVDGKIGMTDLHRGELLCVWSVHTSSITAIGLTTDQTGLWSLAEDNVMAFSNIIKLNDKTWEGQLPISEEKTSKVTKKTFNLSSDGYFFLTNSDGGSVIYRLPSVGSGNVQFEKILELRSEEVVTSVSWSAGECGPVLTGDSHGNVNIFTLLSQ